MARHECCALVVVAYIELLDHHGPGIAASYRSRRPHMAAMAHGCCWLARRPILACRRYERLYNLFFKIK